MLFMRLFYYTDKPLDFRIRLCITIRYIMRNSAYKLLPDYCSKLSKNTEEMNISCEPKSYILFVRPSRTPYN